MRKAGMLTAILLSAAAAAQPARASDEAAWRSWVAAGEAPWQAEAAPTDAAEEAKPPFVHWSKRVGPAYPDDSLRSFGRWAQEMPATVWDDTKAAFTDPFALVLLAAAAGAGGIVAGTADSDVEDHFKKNGSNLNTFWDSVGDAGGNPGTHFAVAGAMYFTALGRGDVKNYEKSKTLINALAINGVLTLALKGIVHTEVPNGNEFGWPSGHTSSSFCFATVMYNEYGPWVGVPCFAFAGFVGYERVDARNHDLSDVVSGALIGIAIGHAVSKHHQDRLEALGMQIVPYTDPATNTVGVALSKNF